MNQSHKMNSKVVLVFVMLSACMALSMILPNLNSIDRPDLEQMEVEWNSTENRTKRQSNICNNVGCYKGNCWAWRQTNGSREWCELSLESEEYPYVPCDDDSNCTTCQLCTGPCEIFNCF